MDKGEGQHSYTLKFGAEVVDKDFYFYLNMQEARLFRDGLQKLRDIK